MGFLRGVCVIFMRLFQTIQRSGLALQSPA
jgi:hypothetical protein